MREKRRSVSGKYRRKSTHPERAEEVKGDRMCEAVGCETIRFSQARKTMQTEGIPDRKYYHRPTGQTWWWEAKAPAGKQSPAQAEFQRRAEACGEVYLLGPAKVLEAHLLKLGLARIVMGEFCLKPWHRPIEVPRLQKEG